jgi:hypothetical protein
VRARIYWSVFVLVGTALALSVRSGALDIPDRWNPWAPLDVDEPLGWLTRYKLSRLSGDPALCLSALESAHVRYTPVEDRETAPGCGFRNAVRVQGTSVKFAQPFTLSCRSAVALALWERHAMQPAALAHFGARVARLDHAGTYACRNIYGRKDAPLSRHATADAIDITGFVLENGRRLRVAREWGSADADGVFLRQVRDGACRVFDTVLGPEYNAAHRDHFHLDRGGWRVCR